MPLSPPDPPYVGRFAPSPTGPLHFGSLLAAVVGWLDARAARGRWLLRIEDLDPPREVAGAADAILEALEAHGLTWDGPVVRQSERDAAYGEALDALAGRGLLFRCRCTRRDLRAAGGVYPGTCRGRGLDGRGAIRLRVAAGEIGFEDRLQGPVSQDLARDVGDFVLRRRDGLWAYQLAVVVDDLAAGVTEIVRGVDLLDSTPRQLYLQRLLAPDAPAPRHLHFPVLRDVRGDKLSKQTGAPGIDPADAAGNVARVLAWLELPADPAAPAAQQLAGALEAYDPARLPRTDRTVGTAEDGGASVTIRNDRFPTAPDRP